MRTKRMRVGWWVATLSILGVFAAFGTGATMSTTDAGGQKTATFDDTNTATLNQGPTAHRWTPEATDASANTVAWIDVGPQRAENETSLEERFIMRPTDDPTSDYSVGPVATRHCCQREGGKCVDWCYPDVFGDVDTPRWPNTNEDTRTSHLDPICDSVQNPLKT